jgi:hypothetical protein
VQHLRHKTTKKPKKKFFFSFSWLLKRHIRFPLLGTRYDIDGDRPTDRRRPPLKVIKSPASSLLTWRCGVATRLDDFLTPTAAPLLDEMTWRRSWKKPGIYIGFGFFLLRGETLIYPAWYSGRLPHTIEWCRLGYTLRSAHYIKQEAKVTGLWPVYYS